MTIESYYDGWDVQPTRTAITRAGDGALVVMHNLVAELPIELRRRKVCEEAGQCGATDWIGEIGFGPAGAETWLGEHQAADLEGGLRAWVTKSHGFYGAACGVYDETTDIVLLVARLR